MAIEKVLNGIEHVHRFTCAVSVDSPQEFLQADKEDQEMAEAYKRLIKNSIICWNYFAPDAKTRRDQRHREAGGISARRGARQPLGRV